MNRKILISLLAVLGLSFGGMAFAQLAGTKRIIDNYWFPTNKKVQLGAPNAEVYYDGTNLVLDVTSGGGKVSMPDGLIGPVVAGNNAISTTNTNAAGGSANPLDITSTLGIMNGSDDYTAIDVNITNADHTGSNTIQGLDISSITGDAQATETAINIGNGWDVGINAGNNSITTTGTLTGASLTLTNSEVIANGTNGAITLTRNDAGTVTLNAADDDATAALTVAPGGAAALTLGTVSTTATTVVSDDTGDAEVVLPVNSIGPDSIVGLYKELILCGENAENGTTYFGPSTALFGGDGSASYALGSAGCDALDNTTEATADTAISTLATKIHGMYCVTDGTLGSGESIVFTMRTAAGNAVTTDGAATTLTCTIGEAATACRANTGTTTNIAAGATVAMQVVETSNNADDNAWCSVMVSFP